MDATQKDNNIPGKPNRMALICCLHRCVIKDTSGFDTGTQKWARKRAKTMWRAMANQAITRSRSRWLGPIVSGWLFSLGFLSLAAVVKWMSVWTGVIKSGSNVWGGGGGRESLALYLSSLKKLGHHNAQQWQNKDAPAPIFSSDSYTLECGA